MRCVRQGQQHGQHLLHQGGVHIVTHHDGVVHQRGRFPHHFQLGRFGRVVLLEQPPRRWPGGTGSGLPQVHTHDGRLLRANVHVLNIAPHINALCVQVGLRQDGRRQRGVRRVADAVAFQIGGLRNRDIFAHDKKPLEIFRLARHGNHVVAHVDRLQGLPGVGQQKLRPALAKLGFERLVVARRLQL